MGFFTSKSNRPSAAARPSPTGRVVDATTRSGKAALTYECSACGLGTELWNTDDEGQSGARAGMRLHMMISHDQR